MTALDPSASEFGTPSSEFKDWKWGRRENLSTSSVVKCDNLLPQFEDLPAERGASLESHVFSLLGHHPSLVVDFVSRRYD